MAENKVNFGFAKAHYAPFEIVAGKPVFETPIPIPGGVEISQEPRGELTEFYADNVLYYTASTNQGYDVTVSFASIPESFGVDCLGEELDETDGVVHEIADKKGKPFAFLFEFDGDIKSTRHILYNCNASRPSQSGSTKTNTAEPKPNELKFVASPIEMNGKLMVKTKTRPTTTAAIYDAWYTEVYEKTAV